MPTVSDLKLDAAGDLAIESGDVVLIHDSDVVAQMARLLLRTLKGEWYLAEDFGVDYFGGVFTKALPVPYAPDRGAVEGTFRAALESLPHVRAVARLDFDFDAAARTFRVDFGLDTDFGPLSGSA